MDNYDLMNITYNEFLSNFKIYESYKKAKKSGYEAHHIVPVSIQGLDRDDTNLDDRCIRCTTFEHTFIHYLLAKEFKGKYIQIFANYLDINLNKLSDIEKITLSDIEDFAKLRDKGIKCRVDNLIKYHTGKHLSEETKEKISKANKGRKRTEDQKINMRKPHTSICGDNNPSKRSDVREKISNSLTGKKGTQWTTERKQQHSEFMKNNHNSGMFGEREPWNKGKKLQPRDKESCNKTSKTLSDRSKRYKEAKESGEYVGTWNDFKKWEDSRKIREI